MYLTVAEMLMLLSLLFPKIMTYKTCPYLGQKLSMKNAVVWTDFGMDLGGEVVLCF